MAIPTYKPAEHTPTHTHATTTPPTPPTPTTRAVDEGHPNAADKPWYERPAHAGATGLEPPARSRKSPEADDEPRHADRR